MRLKEGNFPALILLASRDVARQDTGSQVLGNCGTALCADIGNSNIGGGPAWERSSQCSVRRELEDGMRKSAEDGR